jgi:hypothetical protein
VVCDEVENGEEVVFSTGTYKTWDNNTASSNTTEPTPSLYTTWSFATRMGMAQGLSLVNQERRALI